jgi:DNA-binding beta-propeller fold protein YncE
MTKQFSAALSLALAASLLAACQNAAAPTPNTAGGVAGATHQASKTIPVGAAPHGMWAAAGFVYNASVGVGKLVVIDTATDTVKGQLLVIDPLQDHKVLQTIAVGSGPDKIAVDPDDNKTVFVSLTNEPKVVQFTFADDRTQAPTRKDLAVGTVAGEGTKHRAIAYEHGRLVVPNSGENNVNLIDITTGKIDTVSDGNNPGPVGIGVSLGSAKTAIVGNAASNTITLYDLVQGGKTTLSDVGLTPTDMAVDEENGLAYVTMAGSNDVAIVDYLRGKLSIRVPVGNRPVHVYAAPDMPPAQYGVLHGAGSHEMWVGNDSGDTVSVLDGIAGKVRATVAIGKGHHKMAFWGSKAYISNITDGTVSVIDRTALK